MIDEYRHLSDPSLLRERGLFVAEGRMVVRRVIEDGRYQVRSLMVNEAARRDLADLLPRLPPTTPVYVEPTAAFEAITGVNFHRGCLALIHRPGEVAVDTILGGAGPVLMLEEVNNADNVGGVFRNAAAFGARGVILSPGCCDPLYRKAVRTSMGAVLGVPFARASDWRGAIGAAQAGGFVVVALTPRPTAERLEQFARRSQTMKLALVFGAEAAGVSATVEALAGARVMIPMAGGVDSLNLAVAAGIALYALRS